MINTGKTTVYLLAFSLMLLGSCVDPVDFSEYEGVNLIDEQDFSYDGTGEITQVWTREQDTDDTYMIFEEVSAAAAGTTSGLPDAGAAMFRLEIPNLIPNGDLEAADPATTGWSAEGTATLLWDVTVPSFIQGNVIDFKHSASDRILFNAPAYLTAEEEYSLRFDLKVKSELDNLLFEYNYNDGSGLLVDWSPELLTYTTTDIISFPVETDKNIAAFTATANGYFSIGWSGVGINSGQEGYLDNLRITRIDQSNCLHLDVPFRTSNRPDLLSGGTYTFSLYVKKETDAQVTPATTNRFHAEGLVMGINDTSGRLSGLSKDISGLTADSWTKMEVSYSDTQRVQIYTPEDPGEMVMKLSIIPTDWNSTNANTAGSILISSPELTWTPGS